jgi:hypothetical protein
LVLTESFFPGAGDGSFATAAGGRRREQKELPNGQNFGASFMMRT